MLARLRALREGSAQAELVALRIGQGDPLMRALLPLVQERGAASDQPVSLHANVVSAHPDVQVPAVLACLGFWHLLEDDALALTRLRPVRMPDRRAGLPDQMSVVGRRLFLGGVALADHPPDELGVGLLDLPAERLCPPVSELMRARAIDRDLELIGHLGHPSSGTGPGAARFPHR